MFGRYVLRTLEVDAARGFYADALGLPLPDGASPETLLESWPLHEQARARGAPPHWLGQIAVADIEVALTGLLASGGERLGPTVQTRDGIRFAGCRDPFGAVVGVREMPPTSLPHPVLWHQHHGHDSERARRLYCETFGWAAQATFDVPEPVGGHRLFSWRDDGAPVGSFGNTAAWAGVHTHWLFYFAATDIEATASRVRKHGGTAREVARLPDGTLLCACEDPQGAAFGLAQGAKLRPVERIASHSSSQGH